jgi:hypothetical protein
VDARDTRGHGATFASVSRGTPRIRKRSFIMRPYPLIVLACLAAAPAAATSYLDRQDGQSAGEPVGEDWPNRWQGRRHWFYDDIAKDTNGHSANAKASCRTVPVRVKRSDGTTGVRRIKRCD